MGETEKMGVLYLDGKPLRLTEMPEISFDSCVNGKDIVGTFSSDRSCSFTAIFRYSKMSRKKFVHYLKILGYLKKKAKQIAWYYNRKHISYSSAYMKILYPER